MNWFKHKTDEQNNIIIRDAYGIFGHSGYKFYFILHEIYGKYYNERDDDDNVEISMRNLSKINSINEIKLKQILDYYRTKEKISFYIKNEILYFKINEYKKLHNRWQDKNKKKLSTNEEKAPIEERKEEDRKIEDRKIEKNINKERLYENDAQQILLFLNKATGREYNNTRYITPLLKKGKNFEDFILIIMNKTNDEFFKKNPKLMTPKTLFKEEMFDIYANENKKKEEIDYNR